MRQGCATLCAGVHHTLVLVCDDVTTPGEQTTLASAGQEGSLECAGLCLARNSMAYANGVPQLVRKYDDTNVQLYWFFLSGVMASPHTFQFETCG
jgi:hypothetical protein